MLFFQPGDASNLYILYRDNPDFLDRKNYIEGMWAKYQQYADRPFLTDSKNHFETRLWEMHLALTLLDKGMTIGETKDDDLDILLKRPHQNIWIEATAPLKPDGQRKEPRKTSYQGTIDDYIDPLIPRITQRLEKKLDQINKKQINSPAVIAINSAFIDDLASPNTDEAIIEAVLFGRGNLQINLKGETYYTRKNPVYKANGADIQISLFEDSAYNTVSAILYRHKHPAVTPINRIEDIIVVHNPYATHKITPNDLPLGRHTIWDIKTGIIKRNVPNDN